MTRSSSQDIHILDKKIEIALYRPNKNEDEALAFEATATSSDAQKRATCFRIDSSQLSPFTSILVPTSLPYVKTGFEEYEIQLLRERKNPTVGPSFAVTYCLAH